MSRESERALREAENYLKQHGDENMSEDEMNELLQSFIREYNDGLPGEVTEETASTAEDYCELAESAENRKEAVRYAKKALELDPDCIEAKQMVLEFAAEHPYEMLQNYEELIAWGKEVMERQGFMDEDSIGAYWGILETRPFIRMYAGWQELLVECGMMRRAAAVGEDILRYNEDDNLGIRYTLMHIYAQLEDEKSMLKLHQRYGEYEETQMLLPLSIVYFKLGDFAMADKYLKRLAKANKDTGRFMRAVLNNKLDRYISQMDDAGYRPFTIQEFMVELQENMFLFENNMAYFDWAVQMLKKK